MQLPRLRVGDFDDGQADAAEDVEVDARVAADLGDRPEEQHEHVDAALHQRSRDDKAVAAVAAAAAQHRDAPLERFSERRLDRGDHLATGVFHQHERRNADVLDRPAIRLAHLLGVEHSHEGERAYPCDRLAASRRGTRYASRGTRGQRGSGVE